MKKVMILGASYLQGYMISTIRTEGFLSIAVDADKRCEKTCGADLFYNIDFSDKDKVLEIAEREHIDGVLTYASDVGAVTAAYVAEKLGLPTNPYNSTVIMTDKIKMRKVLKENGFNVPESCEISSLEGALDAIESIGLPVMIKPVDSCGSKGVSRITELNELGDAYDEAMFFSKSKRVVIEKYIDRDGYQIDADCLMWDSKIVFFEPMDQHQDPIAPFSPIGISMPSTISESRAKQAKMECESFLRLMNMKFGMFNIEYIYDKQGRLYILEIAPRAGGNLIPDVIKSAVGLDMRKELLKMTVGEYALKDYGHFDKMECVTSLVIHSQFDGCYEDIQIDPNLSCSFVISDMFVKKGDRVNRFTNGRYGIGMYVLKFNDITTMIKVMDDSKKYVNVILSDSEV